MFRRFVLLVVAVVAIALLSGTAVAGNGKSIKPLAPDQATALVSTPGSGAAVAAAVRRVTPQEALAASSLPGAQTEIAPGLTLQQSVGLAPAPTTTVRQLSHAFASSYCWSGSEGDNWGTWPYDQHVYDNTYWCGYSNGALTYRSTNVTHGGNICSGHNDYTFLLSGGVGYTFAAYRVGAYFDCNTAVPWVVIHVNDSYDAEVSTGGAMFIYADRQQ